MFSDVYSSDLIDEVPIVLVLCMFTNDQSIEWTE